MKPGRVTDMRHFFASVIAVIFLHLPMVYLGSYLALVTPEVRAVQWTISPGVYGGYLCHYRINSERLLPIIFWPLEQVDRQIRPKAWELPVGVG